MTFKEFSNPEEQDYDITSSQNGEIDNNVNYSSNPYVSELVDLIGILEDVYEEDLIRNYGITMQEYFNPNLEVINKVKFYLENNKPIKR